MEQNMNEKALSFHYTTFYIYNITIMLPKPPILQITYPHSPSIIFALARPIRTLKIIDIDVFCVNYISRRRGRLFLSRSRSSLPSLEVSIVIITTKPLISYFIFHKFTLRAATNINIKKSPINSYIQFLNFIIK